MRQGWLISITHPPGSAYTDVSPFYKEDKVVAVYSTLKDAQDKLTLVLKEKESFVRQGITYKLAYYMEVEDETETI